MNMDDAMHIGSRFIEPGVDEYFLGRFESFVTCYFLAVEIDGDDVTSSYEPKPRLLGATRFDENFVFPRNPYAYVTARLLGQVELAQDTTGKSHRLAELR